MKQQSKIYTVKGYGRFPVDMLRYDQSYPNRQLDSLAIAFAEEEREIELYTMSPVGPHSDRWTSFGWTVTEVRAR